MELLAVAVDLGVMLAVCWQARVVSATTLRVISGAGALAAAFLVYPGLGGHLLGVTLQVSVTNALMLLYGTWAVVKRTRNPRNAADVAITRTADCTANLAWFLGGGALGLVLGICLTVVSIVVAMVLHGPIVG